MSWTDERIDRLKELWSKGMTASQIADELGGVSRNAVIGKAHRLGLQSRPSPVKPNEPAQPKAKSNAPPAPASAAEIAPADAPRKEPAPAPKAASEPAPQPAAPLPPHDTIFANGLGGFTPDGREYVVTTTPEHRTPAPWSSG